MLMEVKWKWNGGRASWVVRSSIADSLEEVGRELSFDLKRTLSQPSPPVSAPGEPPHKVSGTLQKAVNWKVNRKTLELTLYVDDSAPHAVYLEYGAPRAGLAPRPFLHPIFEKNRTKIPSTMAKSAKKSFRRHGGT